MDNREQFEIWLKSKASEYTDDLDMTRYLIRNECALREGQQACAEQKDKEIAELENKLAEREVDRREQGEDFQKLAVDYHNAMKEIAALKAELSKHQSSEFHPDWSMLDACRDSNKELKAELSKHQSSEFHPDWSMLEACRENNQEISALYKELKGAVVLHLTYHENGCGYLSHLVLDALCLSRLGRYAV